jgi:hypothetical protein
MFAFLSFGKSLTHLSDATLEYAPVDVTQMLANLNQSLTGLRNKMNQNLTGI